jgi:predicted DNA-binding protein
MTNNPTNPQHLSETLSVRLPLDEFRRLAERAHRESRTLSNLVRLILEQQRGTAGA